FLTGSRDADYDAFAPAAMAAFQCLPHRLYVADTFEREICTAIGEVDNGLHDLVTAGLVRIDEMRHAEFLCHGPFGRVGVDADDLVGPNHPRSLDDVETDAPKAEHSDIRSRPYLRGVDDGADPGRHAAADVTDLVEGCVFTDLRKRNLGQHRKIGEGRAAHIVKHGIAVAAEAAGAIRHHAFALRCADRGAEI